MITLSPQNFLSLMDKLSYPVFREEKFLPYNINILGIRNRFGEFNRFDDTISVYYEKDGIWIQHDFLATTLPGLPSLLNPINPKGTAILKPGYYGYKVGLHKGKTPALVQASAVTVYRDNNKDLVYNADCREEDTGFFGINIHRASLWAKVIGSESYGCQVIKTGFDRFMSLIDAALRYRGNIFTYALVEI